MRIRTPALQSLASIGVSACLLASLAACDDGGPSPMASRAQTPSAVSRSPAGKQPAPTYGDVRGAALGAGASLQGAVPFPADNPWNTDISRAPVDPRSEALIRGIGWNKTLRPDFGAGLYRGQPMGIPYVVVSGSQKRVPIRLAAYADQSDPGPYPIPPGVPVEGGPKAEGDRHVIVVDRDNNRLYELYRAFPDPVLAGGWLADSAAIFHLDSNDVRPTAQPGWTSADAAGLPVFPGLVRYDEARLGAGGIRHALRFTVAKTRRAYMPPASHWASPTSDPSLPPMGMRVRLKASFVIPRHFSPESQAILTALKTHGMILADNGSDWYISGAPDAGWDNDRLRREIQQVRGRDLEVVRMDGLVVGR